MKQPRSGMWNVWTGVRVLLRYDSDGTIWTIRRFDDAGLRGMRCGPYASGYVLICEHRQHRFTSHHPTVDDAKAHRDDLIASWVRSAIRDYSDVTWTVRA